MSFDAPFVGLGAPRATLARPPSCGTSLRNRVHNHYAKTQFKSHPISILTPCHGSSCTSNFRSLFHQGTLTLLNYTYHQTHQQMVYRWSLVQSAIFIGFTRRPNYTNTCASNSSKTYRACLSRSGALPSPFSNSCETTPKSFRWTSFRYMIAFRHPSAVSAPSYLTG